MKQLNNGSIITGTTVGSSSTESQKTYHTSPHTASREFKHHTIRDTDSTITAGLKSLPAYHFINQNPDAYEELHDSTGYQAIHTTITIVVAVILFLLRPALGIAWLVIRLIPFLFRAIRGMGWGFLPFALLVALKVYNLLYTIYLYR